MPEEMMTSEIVSLTGYTQDVVGQAIRRGYFQSARKRGGIWFVSRAEVEARWGGGKQPVGNPNWRKAGTRDER